MANKTISMSKVRQIMKLRSQALGKRKIGERLGMSKNTVKLYIEQFHRLKTTWEELSKLTDFELNKLFHPPKEVLLNDRLMQLYEYFPIAEKQLRRRGMTVYRQFKEFHALHPEGYGESAFYKYYKQWCKKVNPAMHIEHKVGDKMYVDYAGVTLPYVDADTGEIKKAQVFVAILGWSQYAYVEAMQNQTIEEFITACENALHYFKGVPLAIVPDNLKAAVIKVSNYEPTVNENFKAFAEHYGVSILPARSRKPQDKALVENMVKLSYQEIYTNLSEKEILTLPELNKRIWQSLALFNNMLFTSKECSRADQWVMELSALHPLPEKGYEMRKIKQVTVTKFAHVYLHEDQHHYSVPYELIGKKLRMQYSRSEVDIYDQYELVASHKRLRSRGNYTTDPSHMPPQHRYVTEWSPAFFMEKAKAIDPDVEHYIRQVLAKKQHPEQSYKSCMGILSFAKRVGNIRLIKACKRAHEIGYYNYKIIEDILKNNLDKYDEDPEPSPMPSHDNIRGGNYYK
ncbi:IS21-like element ISPsy14 family transposase [soil metagenome]